MHIESKLGVSLHCMGKGLSQITFDFAPAEEEEITPVAPPTVVKEEQAVIKEEIPETKVIENTVTPGKYLKMIFFLKNNITPLVRWLACLEKINR